MADIAGMRILVLDEDPDVRRQLEVQLGGEGHDVVTAADVAGALTAVEAGQPDLIVLDVRMPELREWDELERFPVDEQLDVRGSAMVVPPGQHDVDALLTMIAAVTSARDAGSWCATPGHG